MSDILFNIQPKILFGVDSLTQVGIHVPEIGSRVIVVTEAILYENKTIDRIKDFLSQKGVEYIIFDEVVPNATSTAADDGLKIARVARADAVIGMGGIRTLSMAKAIAMAARTNLFMDDLLSGAVPDKPALAYIEIPTSFRNPFMLSDEYLVTDARSRTGRIASTQKDITKLVFIDPKLTLSLPQKYVTTILLDILLHAIEGFISNRSNFLSDLYLSRAIGIVNETLPAIMKNPDELKPRADAAEAGLLVSLGLNSSKPGIGAALSYAINAKKMVPKSWIAALLLPHILEFNSHIRTQKLAEVARLLGEGEPGLSDEDLAHRAIEASRRMLAGISVPTRLSEFDFILDDMIECAETAYNYDLMKFLPRGVSINEIYEIIKTAF